MKKPSPAKLKPNQLANLKPAWKPGEAPKSPGRPPLPVDVKEERRLMRRGLNDATPEAIELLRNALNSENERNAIRSAEIILSHTVPKLTEEIIDQDSDRPLKRVPDEQLEEMLAKAREQFSNRKEITNV